MVLVLTPLKKAFLSLQEAIKEAKLHPENLVIRDGCIQRFEYTYEFSIKFIKRYLDQESPIRENLDQLNFRDLLRLSAEAGLIQHIENWFLFREARNITSHAYDEIKAEAVFRIIPVFSEEVHFLINELEKRAQNAK